MILTTREHDLAREALARRDRRAALLALRRKKYQETLLSRTDDQLAQLENLTQDVEFALVQKDVYFGLKQGAEVMKEIGREMGGLEGVERIIGESDREREYQKEVEDMLTGKMNLNEEDEVEEELAVLEKRINGKVTQERSEERQAKMPVMPEAPRARPDGDGRMPHAPSGEIESRSGRVKENGDHTTEDPQPLPA